MDSIFAFSDDQVSHDRRNKICLTCTGFHMFKTVGWDFHGETNTVLLEIKFRLLKDSKKTHVHASAVNEDSESMYKSDEFKKNTLPEMPNFSLRQ